MPAVVDAGPLYATADADDDRHEACRRVLSRGDLRLVVPALVVAEATYFVGRRLGATAEAAFLKRRGDPALTRIPAVRAVEQRTASAR
jgi:predicted nucleic acid-binding protein